MKTLLIILSAITLSVIAILILCLVKNISPKTLFDKVKQKEKAIPFQKEKTIHKTADTHTPPKTVASAEIEITELQCSPATNTFYPVDGSKLYLNNILDVDNPNVKGKFQYILGRQSNYSKCEDGISKFLYLKERDGINTVSKNHLCIAKDSKGYFAKAINGKNNTLIFNPASGICQSVDVFDITDGTIAVLGNQWVQFHVSNNFNVIHLREKGSNTICAEPNSDMTKLY